MSYNNDLSNIRLEDDFNSVLEEARNYVKNNFESKCVIHHIKDNTFSEIKEDIKQCRKEYDFQKIEKELPTILDTLNALAIINMFLSSRVSLTKVGQKLVDEIKDPYNKEPSSLNKFRFVV